jgi:signal transduction histidine kinase
LFAARLLARSMGGELRVEDRAPHGSQFVLELPAAG